ncbi:MAG: flagellar filament capping protein FliD, partial [Pseudomonadales bacterium]
LDGFLGISERGALDARTDGLNADLERVGDDRIALDRRIEQLQERLSAQYASLDLLVSNLQSSGNFLLQQLNTISQISTSNRRST